MNVRFSTRYALAALIALAAFGLVTTPAARAQNQNPSPAAILIAKQIMELKGVKVMFDPIVHGVVEKSKGALMQANFMWAKDIDDAAAAVNKEYDSRVSELVDSTARIYATHFTEPELKTILTFYQTPLGRKMITEEPKALDESMINAGKWADTLSEEVMNKMRAELKKRGHDF